MKKLTIIALAITTLATTTALAQTNRTRAQASMATLDRTGNGAGSQAYAFAPGSTMGSQPGLYAFGQYRGWDPDPNIRTQLLRESPDVE